MTHLAESTSDAAVNDIRLLYTKPLGRKHTISTLANQNPFTIENTKENLTFPRVRLKFQIP